jgi:hypothetical protein
MSTHSNTPPICIYTSRGEVAAFLDYPYLFNIHGEWIGWVASDRQVYSVHGHYAGWISDEPRILRKISSDYLRSQETIPPRPVEIHPPAITRLPPLLPELPFGVLDVLAEAPEFLPTNDFGELRQDLD